MARIYDLTDQDSIQGTILTGGSVRLLSASVLAAEPPASYLFDYEDPQYALRNKTKGVTVVRGPKIDEIKPGSDFQALAVVTDVRVIFLVGAATGDVVKSVSHDEIVTIRADSEGMLKSKLQMETVEDDRWLFSVRGDASEVADYIDDAAQTWTNASRLVDEARDRIDASRESLDDRDFEAARDVLEDVTGRLEIARERVASIGDGARTALDLRATELRERLAQLRRDIAAMKGAEHHARAQTIWKDNHDFETAARHYDAAIAEYERALEADGTKPESGTLAARAEGAIREREILRAAPMADAKGAREVALAATDPETAAEEWMTALACYREAVTLDWGKSDREFVVERDLARERAAEATDEAIAAHVEAGEDWLVAGDRISTGGSQREARQAYKRAREHFVKARDIAARLRQGRFKYLSERVETIDDRLAGTVLPSVAPAKEMLTVDAARDVLDSAVDQSDGNHGADTAAVSGHQSEGEATTAGGGGATAHESERRATGDTPPSALAGEREETGNGEAGEDEPGEQETEGQLSEREDFGAEADSSVPPEARETVLVGDEAMDAGETETPDSGEAESLETENAAVGSAGDEETPDSLIEPGAEPLDSLRSLDEAAFTELVSRMFENEGWTTTVFSSRTSAVYDIAAMRDGERQLIWTVHRADGGALGSTVIRRCATARDTTQGTDHGTLVTTGTLSVAAKRRAEEVSIDVVAAEQLTARMLDAGVLERSE